MRAVRSASAACFWAAGQPSAVHGAASTASPRISPPASPDAVRFARAPRPPAAGPLARADSVVASVVGSRTSGGVGGWRGAAVSDLPIPPLPVSPAARSLSDFAPSLGLRFGLTWSLTSAVRSRERSCGSSPRELREMNGFGISAAGDDGSDVGELNRLAPGRLASARVTGEIGGCIRIVCMMTRSRTMSPTAIQPRPPTRRSRTDFGCDCLACASAIALTALAHGVRACCRCAANAVENSSPNSSSESINNAV